MAGNGGWNILKKAGFVWRVRPDAPASLVDRLLALRDGQAGGAEEVKSNPSRAVCRLEEEGRSFYVKWHHFRGWGDSLLAVIRGSRAHREWCAALHVAACGVLTPEPVLLAERRRCGLPVEAFLATREIAGVSLKSLAPGLIAATQGVEAERRHRLACDLGELVRRLHAGGTVHPDLHTGNFIVDTEGRLVLLDLHAASHRTAPSRRRRVQNLAVLASAFSIPGVTPQDRLRGLTAYLGGWRNVREWIEAIDRKCDALRRRRILSRSRRCMVKSKGFTNERTDMGRVYRRRDVSLERIRDAIRRHRSLLAGEDGGEVLKRDRKTAVTAFEWEEGSRMCVKEFIRPGLHRLLPGRLRHKPAVDAWKASLGLAVRGVAGPEALALAMGRGASSWLLMRRLDARPLDSYLAERMGADRPTAARRKFVCAAADFLLESWRRGVRHRDLKAKNVLVREENGGWKFFLLDLEAVRFGERARKDDIVLNLAQLNASTPLALTWTDRLRLLQRLARWNPALCTREVIERIGRLTMNRDRPWQ